MTEPSAQAATLPAYPASTALGALRKAFSFPVMLVAWMTLIVVRLAERNLPDPDIWWHLRNAQFLLANHRLPNFDTYSFTVPGQPWINHEWLGEIPYYLAWKAFGLEGIEILMLVLLEAIIISLVYLCFERTKHIKASILACWLAAALGTVNFGPRIILFGYVYLVVLLIILEHFQKGKSRALWFLPILFCLWINSHGSWSLGLMVFGIFILSGFAQGEWGRLRATRWTSAQRTQLLATFVASCAALFFNPYGLRLVLYPLDMATRQHLNISSIEEWATVDFHTPRGKVVLIILGGLFCSAIATRCRWQLSDLLLILFGFYCGLSYERFLLFAGLVSAPVIAQLLCVVPAYRPEIDKHWLNAAIIAGILAFVAYRFPTPAQLETQVAEQYPSEVLPYLETHPLSGPMLNYFAWGGYLGWKDPTLKVFVDSRVDIFEYAGVFGDYLKAQTLAAPDNVLSRYHIRYVLFPNRQPLAYVLRTNPDWKVVYSGEMSTLLERTRPGP